ncbi:MAG: PEP-CTERM sorting domain-containing protein [Rubrivivax sp.]
MKLNPLAIAAITLMVGASAHADMYSASGTIALTDPTFNRPLTLTSLSSVGTAVHYNQLVIGFATPGSYDFRMMATPAGSFDTFLALYSGLFNPAAPLTNLLALNDDFTNIASGSGFTFTLQPNQFYSVISTAFSNTGTGSYLTTVTSAVPETATYGLMALGLAFVGAAVRRRTTRT